MVHLQLLGFTHATAIPGISIAVYLIVRLIAILGGRVITFFTEKGIAGARTRRWTTVEYVSMGSLIVLMVLDLMGAAPIAVSWLPYSPRSGAGYGCLAGILIQARVDGRPG